MHSIASLNKFLKTIVSSFVITIKKIQMYHCELYNSLVTSQFFQLSANSSFDFWPLLTWSKNLSNIW